MEKATAHMLLLKMEKELRDRIDAKIDSDTNAAVVQEPEREVPHSDEEQRKQQAKVVDKLKHIIQTQKDAIARLHLKQKGYVRCIEKLKDKEGSSGCAYSNDREYDMSDEEEFMEEMRTQQDLDDCGIETVKNSITIDCEDGSTNSWMDDEEEDNNELDVTNYSIRDTVDAIREEASRVDTVMALDQLHTQKCELKSVKEKLKRRCSDIEFLRGQLRARDDKLATLELERDLLKADTTRVSEDLHTCIQHLKSFDLSLQGSKSQESSKSPKRADLDPRQEEDELVTTPSNWNHPSTTTRSNSPAVPTATIHGGHDSPFPIIENTSNSNCGCDASSSSFIHIENFMSRRRELEVLLPQLEQVPAVVRSGKASRASKKLMKGNQPVTATPPQTCTGTVKEDEGSVQESMSELGSMSVSASVPDSMITSVSQPSAQLSPGSVSLAPTPLMAPLMRPLMRESAVPPPFTSSTAATKFSEDVLRRQTQQEQQEQKQNQNQQQEQRSRGLGRFRRKKSNKLATAKPLSKDPTSLQGQVEELGERLRISVEGSDSLRKRLAMVSRYYEGIIRQLQEDLVETKTKRTKNEEALARQISYVDNEKINSELTFESILREKNEEIARLKRNMTNNG